MDSNTNTTPVVQFDRPEDWDVWLCANSATSPGVWLRLIKKAFDSQALTYTEALDVALCHGWIDAQKKSYDEQSWVQRFTPRTTRSKWSKINRDRVTRLIADGRMQPSGLREVEAAQADGRWDAAYDSPKNMTVPDDLQAELDSNQVAQAFFATLDSRNRYAILYRIQTAKKPETRAKRIRQFVAMLENHEQVYP